MGGRDHVGDIVASVTEVQHEERSLDEVANANLADNHVLDDVVLIGQNVRLTSLHLDDLIVSLNLNTAGGRSELHGVTTNVDLDGKRQSSLIGLLSEDGETGARSTVGRDEGVAAGQVIAQSDVIEGYDSLRGNIADTNPTSLDGGQLLHAETSVAQENVQVLQDVDVLVVAVHQIGVNMEINVLLAECELHFNVTSTRSLLDSGGTMGWAKLPVRHERSLQECVDAGESHLTAGRHVFVVDIVDVDAGSSVVKDSLVASLSHGLSDSSATTIIAISITTIVRVRVALRGSGTLSIGDVADHLDVDGRNTLGASLGALVLSSLTPDEANIALNRRLNGRWGLQDVIGQSGPVGLDGNAESAASQIEGSVGLTSDLEVHLRLNVERLSLNVGFNIPLAVDGSLKSEGSLDGPENSAGGGLLTSGNSRVHLKLKLDLVSGVLLGLVDDGLHVASASGRVVVEVVAHLHEAHGEETGNRTVRVDFGRLERLEHNLGNGSLASVSFAFVDLNV